MPAGIKIRCRTSELPGKLKESFPGSFSVFSMLLKTLQILPFLCFYFTKLCTTLIEAAATGGYNKKASEKFTACPDRRRKPAAGQGENKSKAAAFAVKRKRGITMLILKNIKKSYDGVTILHDINLEIEDGEIVSILGPSGCGKTTLLNLILGLTDPDEGQILFNGQEMAGVPMEKRGFNIVFQDYALFPNLNVYKNITYGLKNRPGISTRQEVEELIDLLGLREHLTKKIEQLSGGQKQRAALARTMVMKPKILLLDEPLSALDGVIKESIKEKIRQIARDYHLTTIIVTHDPEEALTLSDKVLIVNQGEISQYGTPEEIVFHPGNRFVEEFILNQLEIKRKNIFRLFNKTVDTQNREAVSLSADVKLREQAV